MAKKLLLTCDLGDDRLKVIGGIIVSFGHLEHVVALCIKRTRPDDVSLLDAQRLTDGVVGRSRDAQDAFEVWAQDQQLEGSFGELMEEVREVAGLRHDVAHGLWAKDANGDVVLNRKARYRDPTVTKLKMLRDRIIALTVKVDGSTRSGPISVEAPDDC